MSKKKIAFISPISNGGPTELYRKLVPLLNETYGDSFECTLINTTSGWLRLHRNTEKYDIIVSVLPFLWKPPHCQFVLNIHGDYRMDRGIKNPGSLLAYLYPYSSTFADMIVFPSEYLKNTLGLGHKHQEVIGNICPFPIKQVAKSWENGKEEFHCITTTNWNNPHKANAILELAEILAGGDFHGKKILWNIIGGGNENYEAELQNRVKGNASICVSCLGYKKNEEIYTLLQENDIFLYATLAESFGIAILEAASQGLPLVLLEHPAFHGLWDEESIYQKNGINRAINQLMDATDYYVHRSENSLNVASAFSQKGILEKWYHKLV